MGDSRTILAAPYSPYSSRFQSSPQILWTGGLLMNELINLLALQFYGDAGPDLRRRDGGGKKVGLPGPHPSIIVLVGRQLSPIAAP